VILFCFSQGFATPQSHKSIILPKEAVEIRPEEFGGFDPCLRDTTGSANVCAHKYGIVREPGGAPERPCAITGEAVEGFKRARKYLKEKNPNLEIFIISSYRPPGHQQCLWAKKKPEGGYKCNSAVCGPRHPKTRKRLPCNRYDLSDPKNATLYRNCPHVNLRTMDVCAYDRTRVKKNERNQMDLAQIRDCRKAKGYRYRSSRNNPYHPCSCRFTTWTKDIREGSDRAKRVFGKDAVEAQKAMRIAMRKAGWRDNLSFEWWHFRYSGK